MVIGDKNTDGAWSDPADLNFGVPQGLVLGLVLFTMYTSPLGSICRSNSVEFQLFADDQQLYLSFKPSKPDSRIDCITLLEKTIRETKAWMSASMLKLNDEKTEFIVLGTYQQIAMVKNINITIENTQIMPATSVRNLGYLVDSHLKNGPHINKICGQLFGILKNIQKIEMPPG